LHARLQGRGKVRRDSGELQSTQRDTPRLRRAAAEFNEGMNLTSHPFAEWLAGYSRCYAHR
jgi:hypothetical protein